MTQRTYTEAEIAALIRRATELQAQRSAASGEFPAAPGLTLDELAAIGTEAGVDPKFLRVAAAELDAPGGKGPRTVTGATGSELYAESLIEGRLTEDAVEDVLAELRHRYDSSSTEWIGMPNYGKSKTQRMGRSVEWNHTDPTWGNETRVLLQPRDERLRVRISRKNIYGVNGAFPGLWGVWFVMAAFLIAGPLGFGALVIADSFLVSGLVAAAVLLAVAPLLTRFQRQWNRRGHEEIGHILEMISDHVDEPTIRDGNPALRDADSSAASSAGSIPLPGLHDDQDSIESRSNFRRVRRR
jgi:hypothetical protein